MESGVETSSSPDHPWRLLICDDSPIQRLALAHFLRANGFSVDESADAESAIQLIQLRDIDLLILDLQMPGKDGFHVLAYLQKNRPGLPVILLSGMPIDEIQDKIHLLPSRELPPLLLKPTDLNQLLEMIDLELSGDFPELHHPENGHA